MKSNKIGILFLVFLIFFCAANAETKIVKGEKFTGDQIAYSYSIVKKAGQFFLIKQPLCIEMQEEIEVTKERKKHIGRAVTILATPAVIFAPVTSSFVLPAAWEATKGMEKKQLDSVQTDRIVFCGKKELGSAENLIIQTSGMRIIKDIVTDSNGALNLKSIVKKEDDEIYFNVFIKKKDSIFYVNTIYF
jgi:hypothetical protein